MISSPRQSTHVERIWPHQQTQPLHLPLVRAEPHARALCSSPDALCHAPRSRRQLSRSNASKKNPRLRPPGTELTSPCPSLASERPRAPTHPSLSTGSPMSAQPLLARRCPRGAQT
ncbi:hypothetical protein K466DRAFT_269753 [Polyporus arcularius HHB13444]|uniref:Uncharacterized protein n=1 Tax=Polyporus arcularius HHB13444 TaxID=1314778 RepID=A0A5C3PQB4_9APHY|nr:hypothetical protein K466DRAFT_269753 [Polyporus arcularius HHB13444]